MIVKIESGSRRIDAMELIRLSSTLKVPVDFLLRPTPVVLSHRVSAVAEDADTEVARESGRLNLALVAWLHEVQQLVELGVLSRQHGSQDKALDFGLARILDGGGLLIASRVQTPGASGLGRTYSS